MAAPAAPKQKYENIKKKSWV